MGSQITVYTSTRFFVRNFRVNIVQGGVMVTYVSKENNLGPDDKIRYIWGLKGPIFIL